MEDDVISIDTLSDRSSPELEIVSSEVAQLTPKELRIKLLNFLVVSPPPCPVQWKSFKEFVVSRFKSYYPKEVIGDVYDQLQTAWSSKKQPSPDSDADSERQSNSSEASTLQIRPPIGHPAKKAVSIAVQATPYDSDEDSPAPCQTSNSPPLFSKSELKDLCRKDSAVKKRSRYIKEMYGILQAIQNSTSCSICKKLKIRLDKFREFLSEESLSIRKKVIQRRTRSFGNGETVDRSMNSSWGANSTQFSPLSSEKSEQMVRDYLVKKVVEASIPEIAKMTEARMEPIPKALQRNWDSSMEVPAINGGTAVNGGMKKSKSKKATSKEKAKRNSTEESIARSDPDITDSEKPSKKKKKRKSEEKREFKLENDENFTEWDPENESLQVADPLKIESEIEHDSDEIQPPVLKKKKSRKSRESIVDLTIDRRDSDQNSCDSPADQEFHECRKSAMKKKKKKSSKS